MFEASYLKLYKHILHITQKEQQKAIQAYIPTEARANSFPIFVNIVY
jgi:hypothetical protein